MPPAVIPAARRLVGLLALVSLAAACGASGTDDGGSATTEPPATEPAPTTEPPDISLEDDYREALAEYLLADADDDLLVGPDEAGCIADGILAVVDLDRLQQEGIEPDDLRPSGDDADIGDLLELPDEEQEAFNLAYYDVLADCDLDVPGAYIDELMTQPPFEPGDRECLEERVDDDFMRRLFVAGPDSDSDLGPEAEEEIVELLIGCGSNLRAALFEAEEGPLDDDQKACLDRELTDETLRGVLGAEDGAEPDPELLDALTAVAFVCLTRPDGE